MAGLPPVNKGTLTATPSKGQFNGFATFPGAIFEGHGRPRRPSKPLFNGAAVGGRCAHRFTKFRVSAGRERSITSSGCARTMVLAT